MNILKNISLRLLFGILLFFTCNFFYEKTWYKSDVQKYSRVKSKIDSAFAEGRIIYMGESSNTSFNPWTKYYTLTQSISDFLQLYLPDQKVTAITHESFHPGLFLKMLNLLPNDNQKRTLIVTLNMRTCGPSAIFSGNEASNQQEALFYSNRLPLLTRIYLSLHFYDNRNEQERERLKFQYWRTRELNENGITAKNLIDGIAACNREEKWKQVAGAYIKEFGFRIDGNNQRIQDLDCMAELCKRKNVRLIFHLLPENRDYAKLMFGNELVRMMDANADFLVKRYREQGVEVINNYLISKGVQYTDQWYPTEHMNAALRQQIAESIARKLSARPLPRLELKLNNQPNPEIHQPMADTMLRNNGVWDFPKN